MIVLINPRYGVSYQPPLGLAYVAAYLRKQGIHDVAIVDTTFEGLEERLQTIGGVDIFGIYIMTPYYMNALKTADFLRTKYPGSVIVAGGPYPTVAPDEVIGTIKIPICVRGEGEHTFLELVEAIRKGSDISKIDGISYFDKSADRIVHNPDRAPIKDLNDLPFPGRDLLPMDCYLRGGTQKTFSYKDIRATTMVTSRGCPFRCTYCQPTLNKIFGSQVRFRSIENVIEEISSLIRDYSVNGLIFVDDTFTCRKDYVMRFCEELLRRKLTIQFTINSRVDTVDDDMLSALKKAGLVTIMYGIESGNQAVLNNIGKRTTINQIERAVKEAKNNGINVYGYFMIGSPEESARSLKDTFDIARKLPFDELQFSMATPYAGTYLYDEAKASGLITNMDAMKNKGYFSAATMKSYYLSTGEIKRFYNRLNLYSKYRSIKNIILKYPNAIPALFLNKILPLCRIGR